MNSADVRSLLLMIACAVGAGFRLPWIFWLWVLIEGAFIAFDRVEQLAQRNKPNGP